MNHAVFLHKQTMTRTLQKLTAHEALLGSTPNTSWMKIYGCAAYAQRYIATKRYDIHDRVELGTYLGAVKPQYRIDFSYKRKVIMRKHATFNKGRLPLVNDSKLDVFIQRGMEEEISQFLGINERESSDASPVKNSECPRMNLNSHSSGHAFNGEELTTSAASTAEPVIRKRVSNDTSDQNGNYTPLTSEQPRHPTTDGKAQIRLAINE